MASHARFGSSCAVSSQEQTGERGAANYHPFTPDQQQYGFSRLFALTERFDFVCPCPAPVRFIKNEELNGLVVVDPEVVSC